MSAPTLQFDHLRLTPEARRLIVAACSGGAVVYLAPLDKGLSGSSVWLARWNLLSGNQSKLHVFKIGKKKKLDHEHEAIKTIASVIEPDFPHVAYFPDDGSDMALLRQQFAGDDAGDATSLRRYVECCASAAKARDMFLRLFQDRMKHWHPRNVTPRSETRLFREALDWWWTKCDLSRAAREIGKDGLEQSLKKFLSADLTYLTDHVANVAERSSTFSIGPIHGDLHAENVLVGPDEKQLELIDYGWTNQQKWKAVDFLMMECSLKFVCSPPHASLADLLEMEKLLDERNGKPPEEYGELLGAMHGTSLATIASAVHATRHSAIELKAVTDFDQYRLGLVLLTACLASLPSPINRAFIFHSIAYHLQKV